jgi:hypothetical protein
MAAILPGTYVELQQAEVRKLVFPPPTLKLQVTVHRLAIPKTGLATPLTTVLHRDAAGIIDWIGSIDERMLTGAQNPGQTPRPQLNQHLFNGAHCWQVRRPERLVVTSHADPYLTIYGGNRPWVVIGSLPNGSLLAVPLNDALGNPKWYAPQIAAADLQFPGSKLSQMELAHIWSLPATVPQLGAVKPLVAPKLQQECLKYFP